MAISAVQPPIIHHCHSFARCSHPRPISSRAATITMTWRTWVFATIRRRRRPSTRRVPRLHTTFIITWTRATMIARARQRRAQERHRRHPYASRRPTSVSILTIYRHLMRTRTRREVSACESCRRHRPMWSISTIAINSKTTFSSVSHTKTITARSRCSRRNAPPSTIRTIITIKSHRRRHRRTILTHRNSTDITTSRVRYWSPTHHRQHISKPTIHDLDSPTGWAMVMQQLRPTIRFPFLSSHVTHRDSMFHSTLTTTCWCPSSAASTCSAKATRISHHCIRLASTSTIHRPCWRTASHRRTSSNRRWKMDCWMDGENDTETLHYCCQIYMFKITHTHASWRKDVWWNKQAEKQKKKLENV